MSEGNLLLAAGALLAAGLGRVPARRAPARCPAWCCSWASGWRSAPTARAGSTSTTTSSRGRIGIVALALILFEGGLAAGFAEIRPVLAPALSLALVGTLVTAAITGLVAAVAVRLLARSEGLLLGSVLAATDGAAIFAAAARLDAAPPARAHAGGRGRASTTRSRCCSCSASSTGSRSPGYGVARHGCGSSSQPDRDRRGGGPGRRAGWPCGRCGGCSSPAPACIRWRRSPPRALAFGARRQRCTARASWPSTWPGCCSGSAPIPARRHDHRLPRRHRLGRADHDVPGARPAGLPGAARRRGARRAPLVALVLVCVARPVGGVRRDRVRALRRRRARRLGWAGLRGAVPVVLATFPVIDGRAAQPRVLQHRRSSRCCVSTLAAGRDLRAAGARRSGVTTSEPALPRPLAETGTIRAARRRGGRVPGRAPATRSSGAACASSGCRATRWST